MKYNEIINFFLFKELPYDIKCLLYSAVAGYHKRKVITGYCDIIKTIKNMKNTLRKADDCNSYSNILDVATFMRYSDNAFYPLNYFYILEFEKALVKYKSWYHSESFTIRNNCPKIKESYGDAVYVYFLDEQNEWNRFEEQLHYGRFVYIDNRKLYQTFMISLIDIYDPLLNPEEVENIIKNSIFKFSIDDLIENYFSFRTENLTYQYIYNLEKQ